MVIIVLGEGLLGVSNTIGGLLRNDTTWNLIAYPLGFLSAALIFALWWSYFEIPWGEILEKKRTFKVGWVFGYIHVFVFASLAAVGTSLELIADTSQQQYMHIHTEHTVEPLFAITALCLSVGIYLLTISILRISLINNSKYNWLGFFVSILVMVVPIITVYFHLNLLWALAITLAGVILYIYLSNWEMCKK